MARHPAQIGTIIRRSEHASGDPADVIHQNVVVFRPALRIPHDAFEDFEEPDRLDNQSGLFQDLAADSLGQSFSCFEYAAGQRPPAFERLPAATGQQDPPVLIEDQRTYSEYRPLRISTAAYGVLPPLRSRLWHSSDRPTCRRR